ncbi:hypothetical protein LJR168_001394 [Pseudoxanthomonas sp. LjRoot168]|uniref:hypothetical protein n=1 Tax=unclassified Pseudoxanthomonas TaxID=2645906 RepID=UPI003ECE7041
MSGDELQKRQREEAQRLARLADPLREARELMDPMRHARELLYSLHKAEELADPMKLAREQLEAARLEPMLRASEEMETLIRGSMEHARQQVEAARMEPILRAREIAAMYRDPMETFRDQLKSITDPMTDFKDVLAQKATDYQRQLQEFLQPFPDARDWLATYHKEQRQQFEHWRSLLDDFSRQIEEMPARLRAQLAVLMERGWCLDPEMPHTWGVDLVEAFESGEEAEAQEWLIDYFRDRLEEIEKAMVQRHPARASIITDAFAAHREGRYSLSIPVILAQAEGVVQDKHKRQLFSRKASSNLKEVLASLPDDDTRRIFMAAFYADIPLTRNTDLLPAGFDGLNRHAVLHGTDPNYGTEVNSLRAVSILNLASFLVVEEEDNAAA